MSRVSKVKILEAFCIKTKSGEVQDETVFRVQLRKGEEPITMFYNQVKHSYPEVLIDFYERQFRDEEESEHQQQHENLQQIFDYDSHLSLYGSKILEHINSFTLSLKRFSNDLKQQNPTGSERVFQRQADSFHENFIQKIDSTLRHFSRPMDQQKRQKINRQKEKKEKTPKSKKKQLQPRDNRKP